MAARTVKFSAPSIAFKLAQLLGHNSGPFRTPVFHTDADGNGTDGDPNARAYGYVWVTATSGHNALVWLDITSRGITFDLSPNADSCQVVCPNGMDCSQIAEFIVSELDRKNIGVADAAYIRREDSQSYTRGTLDSGRVRIIEDQHPIARAALASSWQRNSAAYPLGYCVTVKSGFISGGLGSF